MLGIASRARSKLMPDVPTIAEMGLPGYEGILWIGMVAPAGTPKADHRPARRRQRPRGARAGRGRALRQRSASIRSAARTAEFAALIARELPQWRDLVKAANIKLQ